MEKSVPLISKVSVLFTFCLIDKVNACLRLWDWGQAFFVCMFNQLQIHKNIQSLFEMSLFQNRFFVFT